MSDESFVKLNDRPSTFPTDSIWPSDDIYAHAKRENWQTHPNATPRSQCPVYAAVERIEAEEVSELDEDLLGDVSNFAVVCTRVEMACSHIEVLSGICLLQSGRAT